jgi:hypothetical protein
VLMTSQRPPRTDGSDSITDLPEAASSPVAVIGCP